MKILGIETSTRLGTLAIVENDRVLAEEKISDNLRHAGAFEEVLKGLLKRLNLSVSELDGIGVGLGPGSFTGIRVGLTIAKGLSFLGARRLFGVGTLDAMVHQFSFLPIAGIIWLTSRSRRSSRCRGTISVSSIFT